MTSPYDDLVPNKPPQETTPMKSIFRSKTFWVNALTALAGVAATLMGSDLIKDNPQVAGIGATVLGVLNVLLRLVTKDPVSVSK